MRWWPINEVKMVSEEVGIGYLLRRRVVSGTVGVKWDGGRYGGGRLVRWREASKVVGGETEGGKLRHSMVREAVGRQGSVGQTVAVGNVSHPPPTMRNQLLHCAGLLTHSSHSFSLTTSSASSSHALLHSAPCSFVCKGWRSWWHQWHNMVNVAILERCHRHHHLYVQPQGRALVPEVYISTGRALVVEQLVVPPIPLGQSFKTCLWLMWATYAMNFVSSM